VLWSSSSASVSTVTGDASDSGFVTTVSQGTASISASAGGISGSTTVTLPVPSLVSVTLSPQTPIMPLGTTQQFDAAGTYSDGSTQDLTSTATWTSSSFSATVNTLGLVATAALGPSTIQASFGSHSSSTTVTVVSAALVSVTVSPAGSSLILGQSQQYQAIGTYTDGSTQNLTTSATWFAVPQTCVSVTSAGLVTATGQGNAEITATFGSLFGASTLTVHLALVSISVTPSTVDLPLSSNQQFIAVGHYSDGSTQDITGSVTWASSNPTTTSINATGFATALAGGHTIISASVSSVSGAATITVSTATIALNTSRYQHNATLLNNGSVLIAGGVSCPATGSCTYLNNETFTDKPSSGGTYTLKTHTLAYTCKGDTDNGK
jgi:trimeric autotransporter adhesin